RCQETPASFLDAPSTSRVVLLASLNLLLAELLAKAIFDYAIPDCAVLDPYSCATRTSTRANRLFAVKYPSTAWSQSERRRDKRDIGSRHHSNLRSQKVPRARLAHHQTTCPAPECRIVFEGQSRLRLDGG